MRAQGGYRVRQCETLALVDFVNRAEAPFSHTLGTVKHEGALHAVVTDELTHQPVAWVERQPDQRLVTRVESARNRVQGPFLHRLEGPASPSTRVRWTNVAAIQQCNVVPSRGMFGAMRTPVTDACLAGEVSRTRVPLR